MNDYYTYAFLREDGTPYCVGKGRGRRCFDKKRTINPPSDPDRIIILKKNLTEEEAFRHEIYMIYVLGKKKHGGLLHNITDGGEGVSGMVHSEEAREKIGKAFRGKKLSEEHKEKLRQQKMGNTWNRGRKISEEQKEKIRQTLQGKKHSDERRKNQSLAKLGVKHSPERTLKKVGVLWWNNGTEHKKSRTCPGEGWVRGMLKRNGN